MKKKKKLYQKKKSHFNKYHFSIFTEEGGQMSIYFYKSCLLFWYIFIMKWVEEGVGNTHFILGIRPPVCILLETSSQKKTAVST